MPRVLGLVLAVSGFDVPFGFDSRSFFLLDVLHHDREGGMLACEACFVVWSFTFLFRRRWCLICRLSESVRVRDVFILVAFDSLV